MRKMCGQQQQKAEEMKNGKGVSFSVAQRKKILIQNALCFKWNF